MLFENQLCATHHSGHVNKCFKELMFSWVGPGGLVQTSTQATAVQPGKCNNRREDPSGAWGTRLEGAPNSDWSHPIC